MHENTIRALELDRIVEVVRSFALTPLGAARLAGMGPHTDLDAARAALAATTECVAYVESNGPIGLEAPPDLDRTLTGLAVEGLPLEPAQLRGIAAFLVSVDAVRRAVGDADGGPFPLLQAALEGCRPFAAEIDDIRSRIDDNGEVVDAASSELRSLREGLRRQTGRLRRTLDSYLRGKTTARYLQDHVVMERAGRCVLVVKAEHRGAIPGIVHGSSGSGASLFLEPLSTVEVNNEIVTLREREAAEVQRILLELANALRKRAADLQSTLQAATEIDALQARAAFAQLCGGRAPELVDTPHLELPGARHPLLIPAVRRRLGAGDPETDKPPVPVDIRVVPPLSVLVITGPNTGGKTVALKTAGLLALMAQAGLHVPTAPGARVTAFRTVFTDIGDEQSITASVSTFSGHVRNVVAMDRQLQLPALVLLDEVGAGTDPLEGGALGAELIEHFRRRGAVVVATTHDDMLKTYAATTDAVTCAGFGFDAETYAPNYRLTYGTPGRSLALEIATRLGVPPAVIDAARQRRSKREAQLAEHLAKVDRDLRELDKERQQIAAERNRLATDGAELAAERKKLDARGEELRQHAGGAVDDRVRAARKEIDAIVERLRARAAELEDTAAARVAAGDAALTTGDVGSARAAARAALDAVGTATRTDAASAVPKSAPERSGRRPALRVGSTVSVAGLGLRGQLRALYQTEAEVDVRNKRLRVPLADLREAPDGGRAAATGRVTSRTSPSSALAAELNVIGCTADEALARAERYLDQAVLHAQRQVRIIHGRGSGVLQRSIAGMLAAHPQVDRFAPAERGLGGDGVTVIELKD